MIKKSKVAKRDFIVSEACSGAAFRQNAGAQKGGGGDKSGRSGFSELSRNQTETESKTLCGGATWENR